MSVRPVTQVFVVRLMKMVAQVILVLMTDSVQDYHCYCQGGFRGKRCEVNINDCVSGPCKNNGKCVDGINGYKCECARNFGGTNCEFGEICFLYNSNKIYFIIECDLHHLLSIINRISLFASNRSNPAK